MIDPLADLALFDLRVLAIEAGPLLALALALAAGVARHAPPRRAPRGAGRGRRREPARRSLAPEGSGGGARARRGGERGQIALPGDDEPRNPHAAQRHPRHGRPAARRRARSRARQLRRGDPRLRRRARQSHRPDSRFLQDRGGTARIGPRDVRSAQAGRKHRRASGAAGAGQGSRNRRLDRRRRAALRSSATACGCARR